MKKLSPLGSIGLLSVLGLTACSKSTTELQQEAITTTRQQGEYLTLRSSRGYRLGEKRYMLSTTPYFTLTNGTASYNLFPRWYTVIGERDFKVLPELIQEFEEELLHSKKTKELLQDHHVTFVFASNGRINFTYNLDFLDTYDGKEDNHEFK